MKFLKICVCAWRSETGPSLGPRAAGSSVNSGIPPLRQQCWDYKHMTPYAGFHQVLRTNLGHHSLKANILQAVLPPNPNFFEPGHLAKADPKLLVIFLPHPPHSGITGMSHHHLV